MARHKKYGFSQNDYGLHLSPPAKIVPPTSPPLRIATSALIQSTKRRIFAPQAVYPVPTQGL